MKENVIIIDPAKSNKSFKACYVGCLVLTAQDKILLQQRPQYFTTYPGYVCEFGGKIEQGEQPIDALGRELKEELGAQVNAEDVVSFGAITEPMSKYSELIYTFFWHDKFATITGCYEGMASYFNNAAQILKLPNITDGLRWLLSQCQSQDLIK
ncbi:mutator MutT protein [Legionella beliardensis]|uniref:8-oxo-dGTP diphosphatase n=1 Tax=Legionella beliardensis TaxID=91822 RepID=A0A378JR81_9GAMM|nr:NUDIX hydrolase [Legionella beliardensis]STX55677.1 mutator MutT protein [Legionella beliardensis]